MLILLFLVDASNFLWFPHTWRHNHVHEYVNKNVCSEIFYQDLKCRVNSILRVS